MLIQAQMRVGAAWSDTAILDQSSKGMLLQSPEAPPRGSYVEVRRGRHVIIARVIWTCGDRFGLRSQDHLPVEEIASRPQAPGVKPEGTTNGRHERPAIPQATNSRHDNSRLLGRLMEFACIALFGVIAATGIYGLVALALAEPLSRVSAALGG